MKNNILATTIGVAAVAVSSLPALGTIVLENSSLHVEIVPAWAGRMMFFGRTGGSNLLWTQPEAADFGLSPSGTPMWKNVGGCKTWVGSQGQGWRDFAGIESGPVWPPPAWFDSTPMHVIKANPTNVVLRTDANRAKDWLVILEREFTLLPDSLVINSRLIPLETGERGPLPLIDDHRRLWSVAQVPRPNFVLIRNSIPGRHKIDGNISEPIPEENGSWARISIPGSDHGVKICADGDALAMPLPDGNGWFLLEQTAPQRFLDAIATPGRAMVYASADNFLPSVYAELEFAAYGPDAEQSVRFSIPKTLP